MAIPPSSNYLTDNADLLWHLEHSVDWDTIVPLTENEFTLPDGPADLAEARQLYRDILEEIGRFVAREIAPRAEALDATGCKLEGGEVRMAPEMDAIFRGLDELGLHGLTVPRELGGMNCPAALYFATGEMIARADCGVMTHFAFFGGIAMALLIYSQREGSLRVEDGRVVGSRWEEQIRELVSGKAWGAMVLTEPDAGSDLAAITTRAVQDAKGVWRLTGEKIFITSGHGQHQLVLARTAEATDGMGLGGLSLFWVPRWIERDGARIENVKVTKVEKKLGHASSPTVSLLYDQSEAEMVGKPGEGFELMLFLMNNARVAVGFEALGVCEAALRMARHYALERRSMGRRLAEHELLADLLIGMDTDVRGIRALAFEAVNAVEISQKLEMALAHRPPADAETKRAMEKRLRRLKRQARELTPLLKYIASEKAVELSRWNMQIHGGMGYISETGADRLLRDALVLPIYEGTSQIQALMALKDHLGYAIKDPTRFVKKAAQARIRARTTSGLANLLADAEVKVYQSIETIVARIVGAKVKSEWATKLAQGPLAGRLAYLWEGFLRTWDNRRDFAHGLVHAERLTRMLTDVAIARVLLRQGEEHADRMVFAKRYLERMTPRVHALAMEIHQGCDLEELAGFAAELEHAEQVA